MPSLYPQNIPIIVINLRRSTERRAFMEQQLQQFGVKYEFFPAVDGKNMSEEEKSMCSYKRAKAAGRPIEIGEMACALSHVKVYEKMVQEDIAELLILEDDALLHSHFFDILFQRKKWQPGDLQILHFDYGAYHRSKCIPYYKLDDKNEYTVSRHVYKYWGAYCYVLTNLAARYLLERAYPIVFTSDALLGASYKALPAYTILNRKTHEGIVRPQSTFETTIHTDEFIDYLKNVFQAKRTAIRTFAYRCTFNLIKFYKILFFFKSIIPFTKLLLIDSFKIRYIWKPQRLSLGTTAQAKNLEPKKATLAPQK